MKKILVILLIACMVTGLTACGSKDAGGQTDTGTADVTEKTDIPENEITESSQEEAKTATEEELFEKFIAGEISAKLDYDNLDDLSYVCMSYDSDDGSVIPTWNGAESLTLPELTELVKATPDLNTDYTDVSYAVVDTLSGGKALVVKYGNAGIEYFMFDGSNAFFVFTVSEEELNLVYACDSWSRNYVTLTDNAVFVGYGSNGAGNNTEWYKYIDENGKLKQVYSLNILYDGWIIDIYPDIDENIDWGTGLTVELLTTNEGKFYSYLADENLDKSIVENVCGKLESEGMVKVDEARDKASEIAGKLNIDISECAEYSDWTILEEGKPDIEGNVVTPDSDVILATEASIGMPDGEYRVSFDSEDDISEKDGKITISVEVFNYDSYKESDIESLKSGDGIEITGKIIPVTSVEKTNIGLDINGGWEEGGVSLAHTNSGMYRTISADDYPLYYSIGSVEFPVSKSCILSDVSDYDDPGSVNNEFRYSDMPGCFGSNGTEYYGCGSTKMMIENGEIINITRIWTP